MIRKGLNTLAKSRYNYLRTDQRSVFTTPRLNHSSSSDCRPAGLLESSVRNKSRPVVEISNRNLFNAFSGNSNKAKADAEAKAKTKAEAGAGAEVNKTDANPEASSEAINSETHSENDAFYDAVDQSKTEGPRAPPSAQAAKECGLHKAVQEELLKKIVKKDEEIGTLRRGLADERNAKERLRINHAKALKRSAKPFAEDILSVYDTLSVMTENSYKIENEAGQASEEVQVLLKQQEGMKMTLETLESIFKKHHVTKIPGSVGDKFDVQLGHAAITQLPLGSIPDIEPGCIGAIDRQGWLLHSQVLRETKCVVISED